MVETESSGAGSGSGSGSRLNGREIAVAWTALSVVFLIAGGYVVYEQRAALATHEPTPATVLDASVERLEADDPEETDTFKPVVRYRYRVDGETYTSNNVFPGGTVSRSDREWASGVAGEYDAGEEVTAYYDPGEPGEAFLVRRADRGKWLFVALPLVFLFVGVVGLWRTDGEYPGGDGP